MIECIKFTAVVSGKVMAKFITAPNDKGTLKDLASLYLMQLTDIGELIGLIETTLGIVAYRCFQNLKTTQLSALKSLSITSNLLSGKVWLMPNNPNANLVCGKEIWRNDLELYIVASMKILCLVWMFE